MKYSVLNDMAYTPEPLELIDLSTYDPVEPAELEAAILKNRELVERARRQYSILQDNQSSSRLSQ